jgi:hypothetical protein
VDIYDPVARMMGDPMWERHLLADLPSQKLIVLRREYEVQRQASAALRMSWPRRLAVRLGDGLVALGERVRAALSV